MHPPSDRFRTLFTVAVGAMDAFTGVMLVAAPAPTLGLFGAVPPAGDDIGLRFVGAFVAGVGATCLWATATRDATARARRISAAWMGTSIIRLSIAAFVAGAILAGRLDGPWLVVGGTDAVVAALQVAMLRSEVRA